MTFGDGIAACGICILTGYIFYLTKNPWSFMILMGLLPLY